MRRLLIAAAAIPAAALAHGGEAEAAAPLARTSWAIEALALAAVAAAAAVYGAGLRRLWRETGRGHGARALEAAAYLAGLLALAIALAPPLDRAGAAGLAAHMAQHQLLLLVAPPLLVLGRPHVAALFALAPARRERVAAALRHPGLRGAWRAATAPLAAALLHGGAIWSWHVPALWSAALARPWLHAVQHLTLVATGLLFWWAMILGRWGRAGYGVAVVYVFVTATHTSALGALIAFAAEPWYPANAGARAGPLALEDQQLGGLLMWIPSGAIFLLLALGLAAAWLGELERRAPAVGTRPGAAGVASRTTPAAGEIPGERRP